MNDQTARERMTQERLGQAGFNPRVRAMPDGVTLVVSFEDALTYGDDERAAGMLEAARLICCGAQEPYRIPSGSGQWWHENRKCKAGPIHDAIQAARCTNPAFGCDPEAGEHNEKCAAKAKTGERHNAD